MLDLQHYFELLFINEKIVDTLDRIQLNKLTIIDNMKLTLYNMI